MDGSGENRFLAGGAEISRRGDPTYTGLFNVRKRLRSIYDKQCDFHIDSSDKGSTVSFSLPLIPPEMPDTE